MNYIYNKKILIPIMIVAVLFIVSILIMIYFALNSKAEASTATPFIDEMPIAKTSSNKTPKTSSVTNPDGEVVVVYLDNSYTLSNPFEESPILPEVENAQEEQENQEQQTPNDSQETTPQEDTNNNNSTDSVVTEQEPEPEIPYYIKINYTANTLTIYGKDSSGNYTVPVRAATCSTGTATPRSGVYPLKEYRAKWVGLMGGVYGQYGWQIVGDIMLHSVPYSKNGSKSSLITSYYDRLGTSASAGCIRLTVEDAKWIYENCTVGTYVEFYSSDDPGPIGKPETTKISGYSSPYRNWDPTDPDESNPWHNSSPQASQSSSSSSSSTSSSSSSSTPSSSSNSPHDITITIP